MQPGTALARPTVTATALAASAHAAICVSVHPAHLPASPSIARLSAVPAYLCACLHEIPLAAFCWHSSQQLMQPGQQWLRLEPGRRHQRWHQPEHGRNGLHQRGNHTDAGHANQGCRPAGLHLPLVHRRPRHSLRLWPAAGTNSGVPGPLLHRLWSQPEARQPCHHPLSGHQACRLCAALHPAAYGTLCCWPG